MQNKKRNTQTRGENKKIAVFFGLCFGAVVALGIVLLMVLYHPNSGNAITSLTIEVKNQITIMAGEADDIGFDIRDNKNKLHNEYTTSVTVDGESVPPSYFQTSTVGNGYKLSWNDQVPFRTIIATIHILNTPLIVHSTPIKCNAAVLPDDTLPWTGVEQYFTFASSTGGVGDTITGLYNEHSNYDIMKECREMGIDSIEIGESIKIIGSAAFDSCPILNAGSPIKTLQFHNVNNIEPMAFQNCVNLETIRILSPSNQFDSIGSRAFSGCTKFAGFIGENVNIADADNVIGQQAFAGCAGLTVNSIKNINIIGGTSALHIQKITGEGYTYFTRKGGSPFVTGETPASSPNSGCLFAGNISLIGATQIKRNAFSGCASISSVSTDVNISEIGNEAFAGCSGIHYFNLKADNEFKIGMKAFQKCTNLENISLVSAVTFRSIGNSAFSDCVKFTGFTGQTVTLADADDTIGPSAFSGCSKLTADSINTIGIVGGASAEKIQKVTGSGYTYFSKKKSDSPFVPGIDNASILDSGCLFAGNIPLTTISTIKIGAFAGCASVVSLSTNTSITSIESDAFNGCTKFQGINSTTQNVAVNLTDNVASIGEGAFAGCSNLSFTFVNDIKIAGQDAGTNIKKWTGASPNYACVIPAGAGAFIPGTSKASNAGSGCLFVGDIPLTGITSIDIFAFSGCASITSVISVGDNIRSINVGAFEGCAAFTGCITDTGVNPILDSVSNGAFVDCISLQSIILGSNSFVIGEGTFTGCADQFQILIE